VTPKLPPHPTKWLKRTRETWDRWWASPATDLLDEAGRDALNRLIMLVDDLNRAETPKERRLIGDQVRKGEARLGLGRPLPEPDEPTGPVSVFDLSPDERQSRKRAARARHMHRRRAECDRLGIDEQELAARELDALEPRQETA
jgi:hypothetical protein